MLLMLRCQICIQDLISSSCRSVAADSSCSCSPLAAGSRCNCSPLAAGSMLHLPNYGCMFNAAEQSRVQGCGSSPLAAGFRSHASDSILTVMLLSDTYLSKAGEIIREGLTAAPRVVDDYLSVQGSKRHAHGHTVVIVCVKGRNITALAQVFALWG